MNIYSQGAFERDGINPLQKEIAGSKIPANSVLFGSGVVYLFRDGFENGWNLELGYATCNIREETLFLGGRRLIIEPDQITGADELAYFQGIRKLRIPEEKEVLELSKRLKSDSCLVKIIKGQGIDLDSLQPCPELTFYQITL